MSAPEAIIQLEKSRQDQAAALICEVFKSDPANFYATPDARQQAHLRSWFTRIGLGLGFHYGEIFTTRQTTGVAIWIRPGSGHLSPWTLLQTGGFPPLQAGPAALWRFFRAMDLATRVHRQHVPGNHWYLFILVVAHACQGRGLGGRLIRPILDRADVAGLPCYLETTNPQALPFYAKQGFQVIHRDRLPGSNTPFWGIRREPR